MKRLAKRAVQLYPMREYADRRAVIHLRKSWLRSVFQLGEKWILLTHKHRDAAVLLVCLSTIPVQAIWGL